MKYSLAICLKMMEVEDNFEDDPHSEVHVGNHLDIALPRDNVGTSLVWLVSGSDMRPTKRGCRVGLRINLSQRALNLFAVSDEFKDPCIRMSDLKDNFGRKVLGLMSIKAVGVHDALCMRNSTLKLWNDFWCTFTGDCTSVDGRSFAFEVDRYWPLQQPQETPCWEPDSKNAFFSDWSLGVGHAFLSSCGLLDDPSFNAFLEASPIVPVVAVRLPWLLAYLLHAQVWSSFPVCDFFEVNR